MAPIRRYLRITKYSVLECRIYLDNPALTNSWLLNERNPVLPKVIESVRPLVLPKLREERERSRKKSTKKRGIKDVVFEDEFEVSIFLAETSTRHSLLYKHKHFRDTTQTKLTSNSNKLTGASRDAPIDLDDRMTQQHAAEDDPPILLREEDDAGGHDAVTLHDIPTLDEDETTTATAAGVGAPPIRQSKRRRGPAERYEEEGGHDDDDGDGEDYRNTGQDVQISDENSDYQMIDDSGSSADEGMGPPPAKRRRDARGAEHELPQHRQRDDKKKLAMDISYEGFSIYGRVLCLVIKRREVSSSGLARTSSASSSATASRRKTQSTAPGGGQAVMENWITSTQMPTAVADELDAS